MVSVLTPSFNQGRWLSDTLQSVRRQSYPAKEHIVVDGGSTDDTLTVLLSAGEGVRWISEPDRGQSHALNKAFSMSRGEVIGWLNSDDAYFGCNAIETAVRELEHHPDAVVVYGHAALVDASGLILHFVWVPELTQSLLRAGNFIVQPSVFVRRSALDDALVDESLDFVMDRDLWLRLAHLGPFVRVDRVLAIDRHQMHRKAITQRAVGDHERAILAARHRLPTGLRAALGRKARKLHYRLHGVGLLDSTSDDFAFGGYLDSRAQLLLRQLAVPRSLMSTGERR